MDNGDFKAITPATAKTIMGPNMIDLDEASTIFPRRPDDLVYYEKILFNQALLYYCSEEDNPYILVPGIDYNRSVSRPLTIWELKNHFSKEFPNLFAPCEPLDNPTFSFINDTAPLRRWYLFSKRALDLETIDRLFRKLEINRDPNDPKPWEVESAIVYIYAWILFFLLRKEKIFPEVSFECKDVFSNKNRTKTCLQFLNQKIVIAPKPMNRLIGIVPSIKLNLK